jgi:hypothetical protein
MTETMDLEKAIEIVIKELGEKPDIRVEGVELEDCCLCGGFWKIIIGYNEKDGRKYCEYGINMRGDLLYQKMLGV